MDVITDHRRIVADTARATGLTFEGIFISALRKKRRMASDNVDNKARDDFREFKKKFKAPEYVIDWALDILTRRQKT